MLLKLIQSVPFAASALGVVVWSHRVLYRSLDGSPPTKPTNDAYIDTTASNIFPIPPWKLVFDLTLAASVVIAELVLCEIGQWVNPETRAMVWSLSTSVLLICLVVLVPMLQISSLFSSQTKKFRRTLTAVVFLLWLALFHHIGRYMPIEDYETRTYTELALSRIGFIGITAMGILAGFGAVSAPYTQFIFRPQPVTEQDIERLSGAVDTTGGLIASKQGELRNIHMRLKDRTKTSSTNIMAKFMTHFKSDDMVSEKTSLETELGALSKMKADLDMDLYQARAKYHAQCQAKTPQGRLIQQAYNLFAIYCIYRLINILILRNPFFWSEIKEYDALAITLAHMAAALYPSGAADAAGWTRITGFILSGALFLTSISSVITTFNTLRKAIPWVQNTSSSTSSSGAGYRHNLTGLLVAQLLGTYVISTSLMLRSNLPHEMSSAITSALGAPLDVRSIQLWSDSIFLFTSVVSIVGLYIAAKVGGQEPYYDEESLVEKYD